MRSGSRFRLFVLLMVVLLMLTTFPIASFAQDVSPHLVVNTHRLNVRSGPSVSYDVITSVAGGTKLPVTGIAGDRLWYQVTSNVGTGWVNSSFTVGRGNFSGVGSVSMGPQEVSLPSHTPRLVVNVSYLNIRSGPGVGHDVIQTVSGGTELPVIAIAPGRLWYRVTTTAGIGWANSHYTIPRGDFVGVPIFGQETVSVAPVEIAPFAPHLVVNTHRLNVRSGPGAGHYAIGSVAGGTKLPVISYASDRLWYQVTSPFGTGWVNSYYTVKRGNYSGISMFGQETVAVAPVEVAPGTPHLVINTHRLNVRSGPGVGFDVIGSVSGGAKLPVVQLGADNLWHQVTSPFGTGWVNSSFTVGRGDFSSLRTQRDPASTSVNLSGDTPRCVVNTHRLNVRSGPGAGHNVLTSVAGGTQLAVLGLSGDRNWYLVEGAFGQGWLHNDYVVFRGNFGLVPVVS